MCDTSLTKLYITDAEQNPESQAVGEGVNCKGGLSGRIVGERVKWGDVMHTAQANGEKWNWESG